MFEMRFNALLIISVMMLLLTSCAVPERATDSYQDASASQDVLVRNYIDSNFNQLRSEMAVGYGEHLAKLAELLDIKEGDRERFYAFSKHNFNSLFVSPETTADQLFTNLRKEMLKSAF